MNTQEINHPVYAKAQQRSAQQKKRSFRANLRQDEVHAYGVPRRELQLRIDLLTVMLAFPKEHKLATRDNLERSAMGGQLAVYRREMERRNQKHQAQQANQAGERVTNSLSRLKSKFH